MCRCPSWAARTWRCSQHPDAAAPICHQHADDTTIHARTTEDCDKLVATTINTYCAASGAKLNPDTVFDISSSNDIIGGNSGSPLINAKGEVIGAIFDGNIHSLGGNYGYDPALNRAVAVSAAAVSEALRKVYGAGALADELDKGG